MFQPLVLSVIDHLKEFLAGREQGFNESHPDTHIFPPDRIKAVTRNLATLFMIFFLSTPMVLLTVIQDSQKIRTGIIIILLTVYPVMMAMCFNSKKQDIAGWLAYAAFLSNGLTSSYSSPSLSQGHYTNTTLQG
jgi:hypothetical protein